MFDLRGFLLGWAIVAVIIVTYVAVEKRPLIEERYAVWSVKNCVDDPNPLACARPQVQKLLASRSGAQVMDIFSARLRPMTCHYFGHVVGQETYLATGDVEGAIRRCNRACDSACVHGAVGGAFAEALGVDGFKEFNIDLQHLDPEQLRTVGKQLCTSIGTCHGVGHSLFQIYQEFEPAFALCREIAGPMLGMCYNGATMEYADALTSRSMGVLPDVTYPSEESLATFCDFPTVLESRACFRYMPRIVVHTLAQRGVGEDDAIERMVEICESHENPRMRIACYGGLGSYGSYLVLTNMREAAATCERLRSEQAIASCIIGRVGIATEDRGKVLSTYCAASSPRYRSICYHSLFYYLDGVGTSDEEMDSLCAGDNRECLAARADHAENPVDIIRTYPR